MPPNQADARKSTSLAQALRWWAEAGVDLAIDETPHDRFDKPDGRASALAPAEDSARAIGAARRLEPPVIAPPDEALRSARAIAAGAASLEDLRNALASFEGCGLKATATQLVFSDANHADRRGAGRR